MVSGALFFSTLFLLLICDLFKSNCCISFKAYSVPLHFFSKWPYHQLLHNSLLKAKRQFTFELTIIYKPVRKKIILHYLKNAIPPTDNSTQLSRYPSPIFQKHTIILLYTKRFWYCLISHFPQEMFISHLLLNQLPRGVSNSFSPFYSCRLSCCMGYASQEWSGL